jgi:uncharacterized protein (DUF433 family)
MAERLGNGVYSFPEAAKLAGVNQSTLRSWFTHAIGRHPLLTSDYDPVAGKYAISFLDLIDAKVAIALKVDLGVSTQRVRRVYQALQEMLSDSHPFARDEILHDGRNIWVKTVGKLGEDQFVEVLRRQHGFPQVVRTFLRTLSYGPRDHLATEWSIARGVAVNPDFCFGKPTTRSSRCSTRVLFTAYKANDEDEGAVAAWYGVSTAEVRDSVAFESGRAAA